MYRCCYTKTCREHWGSVLVGAHMETGVQADAGGGIASPMLLLSSGFIEQGCGQLLSMRHFSWRTTTFFPAMVLNSHQSCGQLIDDTWLLDDMKWRIVWEVAAFFQVDNRFTTAPQASLPVHSCKEGKISTWHIFQALEWCRNRDALLQNY
eukprot:1150812-Pelagomonas_calceolata.AAC.1